MANNAGLAKKDNNNARNGKTAAPGGCLNLKKMTAIEAKLPLMDELLEHELIGDISIARRLTRREAEILKFIVAGSTNKQIARVLCRTERTVEYHRNRLMRKFGAHNAAELVKLALSAQMA